jgi:hypothetical protein
LLECLNSALHHLRATPRGRVSRHRRGRGRASRWNPPD